VLKKVNIGKKSGQFMLTKANSENRLKA